MRSAALAIALLLPGCAQDSRPPPAARAPDAAALRFISVRDGRGLIYSFFDDRAELRSVERREQIPATARQEVQVTDPAQRLPGDNIYVADLRRPLASGEFRVWVEPRSSWLERVMPRTSQLRALALAAAPGEAAAPEKAKPRPKKKRPRPKRKVAAAPPASAASAQPAPEAQVRVALFSTAWCPSCRAARNHLRARGVAFVELDVEKDATAAQRYQALATSFKLRPGVVPLIVVAGRPLQGFSAQQLDAALAAAGLLKRT